MRSDGSERCMCLRLECRNATWETAPRGDQTNGLRSRRSRPTDRANLAALAAAAEEDVVAAAFEAADAGVGWHFQALEHGTGGGVDVAELAFIVFPGGVPQLAVDPGDARDEAIGLD